MKEAILHHLDPDEFFLLANTAGCYTAEDAIRYARLARAAGFNEFVKPDAFYAAMKCNVGNGKAPDAVSLK